LSNVTPKTPSPRVATRRGPGVADRTPSKPLFFPLQAPQKASGYPDIAGEGKPPSGRWKSLCDGCRQARDLLKAGRATSDCLFLARSRPWKRQAFGYRGSLPEGAERPPRPPYIARKGLPQADQMPSNRSSAAASRASRCLVRRFLAPAARQKPFSRPGRHLTR
jgi:hypothetical protein